MKYIHLWGVVCLAALLSTAGIQAQEASLPDAETAVQSDADAPVADASPAAGEASVLRLIRFSSLARGAQGQALAGAVGITFALYEEQEGGAPLWLETQNISLDAQGRYTVLLGATSNDGLPLEVFASGEARWLGIQVQGQAEQRVLLASVPYALKAAEADTLTGKTASDFVLSEQLSIRVEEEINTQIEEQGLVTTEESETLAQVDGSGTPDQVAKFTSATTVGDSAITEKGGNVGIGVTNPAQRLVIGGVGGKMLNLSNQANQDFLVELSGRAAVDRFALIGPRTLTNLVLGVGGDEKMRITNAGDVGIGTSTPAAKLDVAGTAQASVLALSNTVSAAEGVLTLGGVRFLHNFGANNTFVGAGAGNFSMTGATNTAFGASALSANTTGSSNAAFGQNALDGNTTGGSNSGFGRNALLLNTAGNANSAFGTGALQNNTASNNSAFGANALVSNITGHYNSAFGSLALQSNTAWENSAFGRNAMRDNTTGDRNAAFGIDALRFNITGASNAAFGAFALQNNTASNNSAFGRDALLANTTGFQNAAFGVNALTANTTGFSNTALGSNALVNLNPGNSNIALGDGAGSNLTGGDNNIYIGSVGPGVPGSESGIIRIGSVGTHTTTHLVGTVNAPAFVGDGSGLTGLSAAALADGSVTEAKLAFDSATQAELDAEAALRVAGDAAVQADLNTHKTSDDHAATYVNVTGDTMTGGLIIGVGLGDLGNGLPDLEVAGQSVFTRDNATSFRLRGTCDGTVDNDVFDSNCESYAGVFYNAVFNDTGGTGARTTRTVYGSNEDMDLEIQGSNHIRITAIDNNVGNGRIRLAAEDEIQFHTYPTPGGSNAETSSLDMTISDGLVAIAGDATVSGDLTVSGTFSNPSSLRWKTNIATLENALATVEQLRGVSYDRLADGQPQIGVIAEEVEEVLPEVVAFDDGGRASGVDYSRLTALLIEAVKGQQRQIRALETELESIKARLDERDVPVLAAARQ